VGPEPGQLWIPAVDDAAEEIEAIDEERLRARKLTEPCRDTEIVKALSGTIFDDHQEMHVRVERPVRAKGDLAQQVRMIAALGAVTAFDDWAPRLLAETEPAALHAELVAVTRDILQLPRRRAPKRAAAAVQPA
jgi:hypothetical protein